MAGGFADQVKAFTGEIKARQLACFQESVQRTVEIIQTTEKEGGHMPVDLGFLRASIAAVIGEGEIPHVERPPGKAKYRYSAATVALVLATANLGDVVRVGYGANYAAVMEYGNATHRPHGFVRLGMQRWPQIVEAVAREIAAKG
jgi:hypothetical protein